MEVVLIALLIVIGIILAWFVLKWIIKTATVLIALALIILVGAFVFSVITGTSMNALIVEPLLEAKNIINPLIERQADKVASMIDSRIEETTNSTIEKIKEVLEE